jgi:UDP-N-acetylglucosamine:LPS N-acetylglucosamine transferase
MIIYSFLNSQQQQDVMNRAKFVISRSGYTTIMELAELGKKRVLFLPTPGMSEQEYLADYYEKQKYFHHVSQYRLKLKDAIEDSRGFSGYSPAWTTEQSVRNFIDAISS